MSRIYFLAVLLVACAPNVATSQDDGDTPALSGDLTLSDLPVQMYEPVPGLFTQEIDHPVVTDPSAPPPASIGTFSQRYWYSTQFATAGASSPVLFYFCGEAPCDPAYATTMADAAKTLNAAVVVLEHRYYGQSTPFLDYTLDHMKYLTIHNALEDAAAFERWAQVNLPLAGKWIAVGGSYPGMLAAFYREQHPELVVGAWASSAPVNVQLSFMGYDQVAAHALGTTCAGELDRLLDAFDVAWKDQPNHQDVATKFFGGTFPASEAQMMNQISSYAEQGAQYGQSQQLCAALLQSSHDLLDGFYQFLNPPLVGDPSDAPPSSAPGTLPIARATPSPGQLPALGMVALNAPDADATTTTTGFDFHGYEWFYQVCTEVGFYQVHNTATGGSIMSPLIDEAFWGDQCAQLVGPLGPSIDATRAAYYAPLENGQVSNVLFVNGSDDPWSSISFTVQSRLPKGLTALVVKTGSHCQDLQNLTANSVLGVFQAHKLFHDLAVTWLQ